MPTLREYLAEHDAGGRIRSKNVAAYLGKTNETVCRWIKEGKIRGYKIGQFYWIESQAEVDRVKAFLDTCQHLKGLAPVQD